MAQWFSTKSSSFLKLDRRGGKGSAAVEHSYYFECTGAAPIDGVYGPAMNQFLLEL